MWIWSDERNLTKHTFTVPITNRNSLNSIACCYAVSNLASTYIFIHIFQSPFPLWAQIRPDDLLPECTLDFPESVPWLTRTHSLEVSFNISIKSAVYPLRSSSNVSYSSSMPFPPPPLPCINLLVFCFVFVLKWSLLFIFLPFWF